MRPHHEHRRQWGRLRPGSGWSPTYKACGSAARSEAPARGEPLAPTHVASGGVELGHHAVPEGGEVVVEQAGDQPGAVGRAGVGARWAAEVVDAGDDPLTVVEAQPGPAGGAAVHRARQVEAVAAVQRPDPGVAGVALVLVATLCVSR